MELIRVFLYIGVAGYGGGPAILGLVQRILVDEKRWLRAEDLLTGISLSQMLPGALVVDTVTFIGYQLRRVKGALVAVTAFLLPSFIIITALSAVYFALGGLAITQALFTGLGAAVVALIINAVVIMVRPAIKDAWAVALAAAAFCASFFFHVYLLWLIGAGALLGWAIYTRLLTSSEPPPPRGSSTPVGYWLAGVAILLVGGIILWLTMRQPLTQMVLAFLRVGLFSFGGGYAAVPLFQHEVVNAHQWLTPRQFVDGIALGQVTPGPVLITATFIGYAIYGFWGALLGTVSVFAPGIVAMLLLARGHERVRHLAWLQAMVRGVVAAYIGVLLNVTQGLARGAIHDWRTALIAFASLLVLFVWKKDPLWVVLGTAVVSPLLF